VDEKFCSAEPADLAPARGSGVTAAQSKSASRMAE